MARYTFFCSSGLDRNGLLAAKKTVQTVGASVVRSADGSMLVEASTGQLRRLAKALPDWRYCVERNTTRLLQSPKGVSREQVDYKHQKVRRTSRGDDVNIGETPAGLPRRS